MMRVTPEVNTAAEFLAWKIAPNARPIMSRNSLVSALIAYAQSLPIDKVRQIYDLHMRSNKFPLQMPSDDEAAAIAGAREQGKAKLHVHRKVSGGAVKTASLEIELPAEPKGFGPGVSKRGGSLRSGSSHAPSSKDHSREEDPGAHRATGTHGRTKR